MKSSKLLSVALSIHGDLLFYFPVLMNGAAIIFLGFVAFGVLHTKSTHVHPWQWFVYRHTCAWPSHSDKCSTRLMIITGLITFFTSILFWYTLCLIYSSVSSTHRYHRFLFPDSPASAWFLTPEDRRLAALRIRENQTGIENKHFKTEQYVENENSLTLYFQLMQAQILGGNL